MAAYSAGGDVIVRFAESYRKPPGESASLFISFPVKWRIFAATIASREMIGDKILRRRSRETTRNVAAVEKRGGISRRRANIRQIRQSAKPVMLPSSAVGAVTAAFAHDAVSYLVVVKKFASIHSQPVMNEAEAIYCAQKTSLPGHALIA